jgi:ABC-2 type transport system ATP-binding protein
MAAIEIEQLRRVFGEVIAVDGIDLTVPEGEIFAFLGPNGAGKSTTTKILTTLLRPTSGRATVAGIDVVRNPHEVRRRVGVALQEAGLDDVATGREMIALIGRLHGLRPADAAARADEILHIVGLTDAAERRVGTYSGGMKRRLDLGTALVHRPKIVFLDEPTTGLDPASRQAIWDEVARLNREDGVTVFLTTQYLEEADRLADRVAIIDHGKIVALGTSAELKAQVGQHVVSVTVGDANVARAREALAAFGEVRPEPGGLTVFSKDGAGAIASVVRALDAADVPVEGVSVSAPTLDEVFLRATGSRLEGAEESA